MARGAVGEEIAVGLNFNMDYDDSHLTLDNFYDDICFAPGMCFNLSGQPLYLDDGSGTNVSGHSVVTNPTDVVDWVGGGGVILVNTACTDCPISLAYYDGGIIEGEPVFVEARFAVSASLTETTYITLDSISAANDIPQSLEVEVTADGVIKTGAVAP